MNNYIIEIEPKLSHISERIHFSIENLPPDTLVKVEASSSDYYSINSDIRCTPADSTWTSSAEFYTDKSGNLDLSKAAPIKGSYKKADEMGLLYSMKTVKSKNIAMTNSVSQVPENKSYTVNFTFTIGSQIIYRSIKRCFCANDILSKDIDEGILKGRFFVKNDGMTHPAIIVLSGSDGRIEKAQAIAECLSTEGFASLALCYFGMDKVSPSLEKIPLEIVEEAVRFLKSDVHVDKNKIGIYGRSKGAEMALEAASLFSDISCVSVTSPSCITYAGLTAKGLDSSNSSWSYNGKELPFKKFNLKDSLCMVLQMMLKKRKALSSLYEKTLQNDYNSAMIHLEKINGPILFITSDEDEIWPSKKYGIIASSYLKNHNFKYDFIMRNYQYAGHMMTLPYQSIGHKEQISKTLYDYVYGSVDSWNETVSFYKRWAY